MTSRTSVVVVAASLLLVGVGNQYVHVQSTAEIGNRPITHAAVVVRDIDRSARAWAEVLGLPLPEIRTAELPLGPAFGTDRKASVKVAFLYLPNFYIELNQPTDGPSPWRDHLEQYGPGLHHLGFSVNEGLDEKVARLQNMGGRFVAGAPGGRFAFLDFRERLGSTFELVEESTAASPPRPKGSGVLANTPVYHVGIAAVNVDDVSRRLAEVLGIEAPEVRQGQPGSIRYPPNSTWNPDAHVRSANIMLQDNIRIEMLQPIGSPSPWADAVAKQRGTALHHIAWRVGDRLVEMIQFLQSKGGKWTNGGVGGTYAYLDFTDGDLGVVIEVTGTSTP